MKRRMEGTDDIKAAESGRMRGKMRKNEIIELKIEDMGANGEGIGRFDGMTFFVKDAIIGDTIRAKVIKLKKNYGYARVEEITEASPYRIAPRCTLHRRCGGCQIQTLDYSAELSFKEKKIRNHLIRLGGFDAELIDRILEPIVGMEEPFRYRNKAQFPIGRDKEGRIVAGFYAAGTHCIIPVSDCLLGISKNKEILQAVISYMNENNVEPYDETTGKGLIRHVLIRCGFSTGEIMVCLVINGKDLPKRDELCKKLHRIDGMTCISFNCNQENTNVILGAQTETIWGKSYITDYLCYDDVSVAYHISPQSFYQVNSRQAEKLYGLALEYAGLTGKETVWDLYCGIGTISLFLAGKADKVYGVEVVPQAVEDAKMNARLNNISNVDFFAGKAEEILPEFYRKKSFGKDASEADMLHPDVIVVDPPRKGCDEKCLETMLKMQPKRIVYVSCDSATLARDLKTLCGGGYELKRARGVDQFGNTVHVEVIIMMQYCGKEKN